MRFLRSGRTLNLDQAGACGRAGQRTTKLYWMRQRQATRQREFCSQTRCTLAPNFKWCCTAILTPNETVFCVVWLPKQAGFVPFFPHTPIWGLGEILRMKVTWFRPAVSRSHGHSAVESKLPISGHHCFRLNQHSSRRCCSKYRPGERCFHLRTGRGDWAVLSSCNLAHAL